VGRDPYEQAKALMQRTAAAYRDGGPEVRRQLNRAFLHRIEVDTDSEDARLGSPWQEIRRSVTYVGSGQPEIPQRAGSRSRTNPDPLFEDRGSTVNPLVDLRGLEPLTPTLPGWHPPVRRYPPTSIAAAQIAWRIPANGGARGRTAGCWPPKWHRRVHLGRSNDDHADVSARVLG